MAIFLIPPPIKLIVKTFIPPINKGWIQTDKTTEMTMLANKEMVDRHSAPFISTYVLVSNDYFGNLQ